MTVLFESCLVYGCDLLTLRELSSFVALEMTQCVAPWWGMLGGSQARLLGASPHLSGVPLGVIH